MMMIHGQFIDLNPNQQLCGCFELAAEVCRIEK